MKENPGEIAARLAQEHGLDQARVVALTNVIQAQSAGDNYALSIWRDVKRLLARDDAPGNQTAA